MAFEKFDEFLSNINDYHLPFGIGVFGVGSILQWFKHLDPTFVAFSSTILGFIGGHAYLKLKNDPGNGQPPAPPPAPPK